MVQRNNSLPPKAVSQPRTSPRGPTRHEEYVRRVRNALGADYSALRDSPLCELPGVQALARSSFNRKIYPAASALRALLDRAYTAALEELADVEDRRVQEIATYLRLSRQGVSVIEITHQLGFHSRSYVHREIQRQALELVTDAFLQLARQTEDSGLSVR